MSAQNPNALVEEIEKLDAKPHSDPLTPGILTVSLQVTEQEKAMRLQKEHAMQLEARMIELKRENE